MRKYTLVNRLILLSFFSLFSSIGNTGVPQLLARDLSRLVSNRRFIPLQSQHRRFFTERQSIQALNPSRMHSIDSSVSFIPRHHLQSAHDASCNNPSINTLKIFNTQGQPSLVNALARQAYFKDVTDCKTIITKKIIAQNKEKLILRRDAHLDVLIDRLSEPSQ